MNTQFNGIRYQGLAEAQIDVTNIGGAGSAASPQIWVPIFLTVPSPKTRGLEAIEVVSLSGRLSAENKQISISAQVEIGQIVEAEANWYKHIMHNLEFSVCSAQIAALESHRNGGNLKLRMDAVLCIRVLRALSPRNSSQKTAEQVWGLVRPDALRLQTDLTISRDVWISRVLPAVNYGVVHVLELPAVPIEACAAWEDAFKALQQAQELHKIGLYDNAAGKCRVALEKFFDYEERTDTDGKTICVPVPKKSWEVKVGKATYDWLTATFRALKGASNLSHHSPAEHFSQADSQMLLAVTTALVAYVARTFKVLT